MITQEEYNRIEKQNVSLKEQEILTYTTNGKCGKKQINIAGQNYQVKKRTVRDDEPAEEHGRNV